VRGLELNDSTVGESKEQEKEKVKMGDRVNVRYEQMHNSKIKLMCFDLA